MGLIPVWKTAWRRFSGLQKLFILGLAALALGLLIQPVGDPDVYLHLRDGQYLVEHGLQVSGDPFSYTASEKPFERAEWLFRIGLYEIWKLGGYTLLTVLKAAAMTLALFWVGCLMHRRWSNLGVIGLLLGAAVLSPMQRIFPERPFVATYLCLPLVMLWMDDARRAAPEHLQQAIRRLWAIPILIVPWANLHPGFVVVFGILAAHGLEIWLEVRRNPASASRQILPALAAVTAASLAAGCLTPMGAGLYPFILKTMTTSDFMQYILEWAPPTPAGQPFFFLLLGLSGLLWLLTIRSTRLSDLLPLAAFGFMAVRSYRNIPLFLIAALPAMTGQLRRLWEQSSRFRFRHPLWKTAGLSLGVLGVWGLLGYALATGVAFQGGEIPAFYPRNALQWIQAHPIQGRLLSHDIWGGYIGWQTHGRLKVFMDGRMPTFGPKLYADYRKLIWGDSREWSSLISRYQIDGLLVSPKNELRLYQQVWQSRQWALVYWDDVALLYLRRNGPNEELIRRFEYRAVDPKRTLYFHPGYPEIALQEARRAGQTAPDSFLPYFFEGELLMRLGRADEARRAFDRVLALAPGHLGTLTNLGLLALGRQDARNAELYFRSALRYCPAGSMRAQNAFFLAQTIQAQPGRKDEALGLARLAQRELPQWDQPARLVEDLTRSAAGESPAPR